MDRFGPSAPSLDELKQIQSEVRQSQSLKHLREYFGRVQELRRIHSGNFDVQLAVAEAQEEIIQRARDLERSQGAAHAEERIISDGSFGGPIPSDQTSEELPEHATPHPDSKNWRRATLLALALTAIICIVFFYLIQTARRINLPPTPEAAPMAKTAESPKAPVQNMKVAEAPVSTAPTVRLYTDLIPGTVSIDDGDPQDLKDGELVLDHLEPGRHSIKVAGRSGTAAFSFDVSENTAPQAVAPLTATNAVAVGISAQDGNGHLLTSLPQADISLDGKPLGPAGPDGLAIGALGKSDHELEVAQGSDRQRFILTYTPAPVLTVYLKSVLNLGTVTLMTKQDGVSIFIQDKLYRRKTEHGQIRIPLKVGTYVIHVHKDGFTDPPPQQVEVKKSEETELTFNLEPAARLASLDVRGAVPGTAVYVDKEQVATAGADGHASAVSVNLGDHSIELRLEGSAPKKFQREFQAGNTVSLGAPETALQKIAVESKVPEQPAAAPVPAESSSAVAAKPVELPGEQVRRGGGFVHYSEPKTAGRYSFQARSRIGGFLKHDKLQWYAGYENSDNYILFTVDGKHASVRVVRSGKAEEINRIPFSASSGEWVQVDLSVKPDAISTKIKTPQSGWHDLGTVASGGRDFTQDKVGFYLPGNDEVAVANFRFANH